MGSVPGSQARFPWSSKCSSLAPGLPRLHPHQLLVISDSSRSYKCVIQTSPRLGSSPLAPPGGRKPWAFSPGTFLGVGSLLYLDTAAACGSHLRTVGAGQ